MKNRELPIALFHLNYEISTVCVFENYKTVIKK